MKQVYRYFWIALIASASMAVSGYALDATPPELNSATREKIEALQANREALRAEIHAMLDTLPDASREEKLAALQAWREQNAERIAAQRQSAQELKAEIRTQLPNHPPLRTGPPDFAMGNKAQAQALSAERKEMQNELKTLLDGLSDATQEERLAAIEAWREQHAELVAAHRDQVQEMAHGIREQNEGMQRPPFVRPGHGRDQAGRAQGQGMQEQSAALREEQQALRDEMQALAQTLAEASREERLAAIEAWRTENADKIETHKEIVQEMAAKMQANRPQSPIGSQGNRR
jgi:hypothetical protein